MSKILFIPSSAACGLVAGLVGKKMFEGIWSLFDEEPPPDPKDRGAPWKKVLPALLLEGAIFRAVRGVVDRALRKGLTKLTGSWPGDKHPEPA